MTTWGGRYSEPERDIEERTRELATLLEVSRAIASTLELGPLLDVIIEQLKIVMHFTGATILLREGDDVVVVGDHGSAIERHPSFIGLRVPIARAAAIWEMVGRGEPVIIDDVRETNALTAAYRAATGSLADTAFSYIRTWMAVPMLLKEQVIGLLTLAHHEPGFYTRHHAQLALAVANQVAVAIENARLYEQARELAALAERQRLARDLHDSVTQSIFSLGMMAKAAQEQHERGSAKLGPTLGRVASLAQEALIEMRALLFELQPQVLIEQGLAGGLERLAEGFRGRAALAIHHRAGTTVRLAAEVELAVFRIVQEALGNVVKHAQADEVTLSLTVEDQRLRVHVRDNGRGFDAATPAVPLAPSADGQRGGQGMHSMRQRAAAAGLVLQIESAIGTGTLVCIEAPIPRRTGPIGTAEPVATAG